MRAVVQRVSRASVRVKGEKVADIGPGLMVLVGLHTGDVDADLDYMAKKILGLRIFDDDRDVMNLSLTDVNGELLLVSQFTLYGDSRRGRRPSYSDAMPPEKAAGVYRQFVDLCGSLYPSVQSGEFGAEMQIELVNEGPVTILLDSSRLL